MGDLLKEAIADAKAVRETALQNAKMALEEAFTPQLKSMLSAKLKEDEEAEEGEHDTEEGSYMEDEEAEEGHDTEEGSYMEDEEAEEGHDTEETYEEDEVEEDDEVPAADGEEDDDDDDEDEDEAEEGDLDLEAVIKELESELEDDEEVNEDVEETDNAYDEDAETAEGGEPMGEGEEKEEDDDVEIDESLFNEEDLGNGKPEETDNAHTEEGEEDIKEQSKSSEIGKGDNKGNYASGADEEDPGKGEQFKKVKMESIKSELKEYKEAVKFLKDKLHEVNILNAKLLFTNKLFKAYSLNNNQKLKVVETFDRAQTTREIKLVYSTLAEQFGDNGAITRKKSITESASSAVSSTKPSKASRKVITEETKVANRFKKLAGIIK